MILLWAESDSEIDGSSLIFSPPLGDIGRFRKGIDFASTPCTPIIADWGVVNSLLAREDCWKKYMNQNGFDSSKRKTVKLRHSKWLRAVIFLASWSRIVLSSGNRRPTKDGDMGFPNNLTCKLNTNFFPRKLSNLSAMTDASSSLWKDIQKS